MREPIGGINPFRRYYKVQQPLRFHTTTGNAIDEVKQYRQLRERPPPERAPDGLKILLVGELAYNADRVLALEELGHRLYGLWTPQPYWYNTVGPLPFGHVQDLPQDNWREAVRELAPDVIYALLNWQAVPFAQDIHLHFYGDFTQGQWRGWIETCRKLAPQHLHLHANVDQPRWVTEFSRYDAGWLHCFESKNKGEIRRAEWDDLNYPARMATLARAGLPMIQRANPGALVATQSLTKRLGMGFFLNRPTSWGRCCANAPTSAR